MNSNILYIVVNVLGTAGSVSFFLIIYYKLKLMGVRKDLQREGQLDKSFKVYQATFFELIFWMLPVFVQISLQDKNHRKLMWRINILWFLMVFTAVVVYQITLEGASDASTASG
jgi:L-asparagine transporter-like permease